MFVGVDCHNNDGLLVVQSSSGKALRFSSGALIAPYHPTQRADIYCAIAYLKHLLPVKGSIR